MRKILHVITRKSHKKTPSPSSAEFDGVKENDEGLKIIYHGAEPAIDLVAVHGDGGHWRRSWTDRGSGFCWLADVLPVQFPSTRILSYGYHTGDDTPVEEIAAGLVGQLASMRDESIERRPIIFIAHSFGGILIKGALAAAYQALENSSPKTIASSTCSILLFGSPVSAGKELDFIAAISLVENDGANETPAMKAMKRDAQWLQRTNQEFKDITPAYKMAFFKEQAGEGRGKSDAVKEDGVIQLNKTHGAMIRYATAGDEDLKHVLAVLGQLIEEILDI